MKTIVAIAAVSILALSIGAPQPASARNGGAVAAGVIGGLAAGAIIGGAVAGNRGYYGGPAYVDQPAYVVDPGYRQCHMERQEFEDRYGNLRVRRIRVCD
jgi:hypothetical protein